MSMEESILPFRFYFMGSTIIKLFCIIILLMPIHLYAKKKSKPSAAEMPPLISIPKEGAIKKESSCLLLQLKLPKGYSSQDDDDIYNYLVEELNLISQLGVCPPIGEFGQRKTCNLRSVSCLKKVAQQHNASQIVYAQLLPGTKKSGTLSVYLIDSRRGSTLRKTSKTVTLRPEDLRQAIKSVILALLYPDSYFGAISLAQSDSGIQIFLDEQPMGVTPEVSYIPKIEPGKHLLSGYKQNFKPFKKEIIIAVASTIQISMILEPEPLDENHFSDSQPFYKSSSFYKTGKWSSLGVSAGFLLLSGVFTTMSMVTANNYNSNYPTADTLPEIRKIQDLEKKGTDQNSRASSYFGISLFAGMASGVFLYFEDDGETFSRWIKNSANWVTNFFSEEQNHISQHKK